MFTGLISDVGVLEEIYSVKDVTSISVKTNYEVEGIKIGASIANNGCCLTVVEKKVIDDNSVLKFELSPETMNNTDFANISKGDLINLEQSLKVGDELGGHFVTGHVDGLGEVTIVDDSAENWLIEISAPKNLKKYIAKKGSVTVSGVSLTVNEVNDDKFQLMIIPHTLKSTNLKNLAVGKKVNIEIDILARYIDRIESN